MNKIQVNTEQRSGEFINYDNSNSKDKFDLNTSIEKKEIENNINDSIIQDFLNKKIIDLSFLDDTAECQINQNNINNDNIDERNNNYNYIFNWYTMSNYEKSESIKLKGNINEFSHETKSFNNPSNLNQNSGYYYPMTFNNNVVHNYIQINNSNFVNKIFQNNIISYKINPSNQVKKYIDKRYSINLMDIRTNKERRTTIRILNIPKYFQPQDLARKIDEKFGIFPQKENRVYDFIYIPFNKNKNGKISINEGFAFINFVHPKHIIKFYSFFQGKHLKSKTSKKVCLITFAKIQGIYLLKDLKKSRDYEYIFFTDTKNHFQLFTD